jgi:hypothetical protein
MKHELKRERAGKAEMGSITPTCSCGWRGRTEYAYNDYCHTNVKEQEGDHIRNAHRGELETANATLEQQGDTCPTCGSECNERDELTKAEREIERLRAEVEALRADALKHVDCRQCKHATNRGCHSTALCERGELFEATPPWQFYDAARAAQGVV